MHYRLLSSSILTTSIFSFLLLITSAAQGQKVWTLQGCIDQALENNLALQRGDIDIQATEARLKQAKLARWPNLSANTSYGLGFGRATNQDNITLTTNVSQSQNYSVNSAVNLFSGFATSLNIRQNEALLEASQLAQDELSDQISLQVANAYLGVLLALEDQKRARTQLELSEDNLENSQKLVDAGTIPEGNLRDLEAQVATDQLGIINASNTTSLAKLNLQLLMLVDENDFEVEIPSDAVFEAILLTSTDWDPRAITEYAATNLPQFKGNDLAITIEDFNVDIAKSARWPSIGMSGGINTTWFTVSDPPVPLPSYGDQLNDNLGQSLAMRIQIPIFSNGITVNNIRQAEFQRERVLSFNQEERNILYQTISQAVADAKAFQSSYKASMAVVEARQQALDFTERRFNAGQAASFEFTNARNLLAAAQVDAIRAKYNYIFAIKVLDFYQGSSLTLD